MAYLIAGIIAFGIFQFLWSIRLAYRIQLYQTAPGYPVLGHVLHTLTIIVLLAALAPKTSARNLPGAVRAAILLAGIALPFVHGWLLIRHPARRAGSIGG